MEEAAAASTETVPCPFWVSSGLAQKLGAALVRYQHVLDEAAKRAPADYWVWDAVHPTYRGHQLMADEWERVVGQFWK